MFPYVMQDTPYGPQLAYCHVGIGGLVTFVYAPVAGRCDVETYTSDLSDLVGCGNYRESDVSHIVNVTPEGN